MEMTGEYRITAPRQKVWEALNDPAVLQQCIPGCETIEKHSPTEMSARVTAKVGPVRAKFTGKVTLSDLDPPNGYKITGEGTGGAAGFAKGGADVRLTDDGPATMMRYAVQAHVGGKLAQIGSRLIDGTARKMADEFFAKFAEIVGGSAASGDATTESAPAAAPTMPATAPAATAAAPAPPASPALSASPAGVPTPGMPASTVAAAAMGVDAPAGAALAAEGTSPPLVADDPARSALPPILWMLGLTVVVVGILYWFARGH